MSCTTMVHVLKDQLQVLTALTNAIIPFLAECLICSQHLNMMLILVLLQ